MSHRIDTISIDMWYGQWQICICMAGPYGSGGMFPIHELICLLSMRYNGLEKEQEREPALLWSLAQEDLFAF